MKTTKRLIAFVIAAIMAFAFALPVFADETYTITVNNATIGHTYKAYKVFDASLGKNDAIVYTYNGTLPTNDYFGQDDYGYVTATDDAAGTDGKLTPGAIAFLAGLVDVKNSTPAASVKADADTVTLNVTAPGYYYVTSTLGTAVSVDTTRPKVTIIDKNQTPSWDNDNPGDPDDPSDDVTGIGKVIVLENDEKVTENSANYGDTVNFDIGINATNFYKEEIITYYYIKDTLGAGFTLPDNFAPVVTVGEVTLTADTEYTLDIDDDNNTFEIAIKWAELNEAGDNLQSIYSNAVEIHVGYYAIVNENAVIGEEGNLNTANFTYDSAEYNPDPDDYNEPPEDPEPIPKEIPNPDEDPDVPDDDVIPNPDYPQYDPDNEKKTTTYVFAFALNKVDEDGDALPGATFKFVTANDSESTEYVPLKTTDIPGVYVYDEYGAANSADNHLACDGDGKLLIKGLEEGTYYLVEVDAPAGYNKNDNPIKLVAVKDETQVAKDDTNGLPVNVEALVKFENTTGTELPATGGIGTTLFITFGAIAVLVAGIFLVTNKRMSKESF